MEKPCVAGILFEGEAEQGDPLVDDRVEELGNYFVGEAAPLPVVHFDHLRLR
jgi:hypothetical protein